ncbi:MAG: hypothetical protein UIM53_07240 [Acutalibacteraceae bacterium]|nr:hypothetical protein [Acutalibacteraceae bacterium]
MFIELHKHKGPVFTINLNVIEYFTPVERGMHTMISVPSYNGWLQVEESYAQVKELIEECQKK